MKYRLYEYLESKGYGIEEHGHPKNRIELWDDKTYLFIGSFDTIEDLADWVERELRT